MQSVKTANIGSFVYTPPPEAFNATRILVKPNLGLPAAPPATVTTEVLAAVLRGLRRANPMARIVIGEGACSPASVRDIFAQRRIEDLLDNNMRMADLEDLQMAEYPNLLPQPVKFRTMIAPAYILEYDCCISIGTFKRTTHNGQPLISAALKNLYSVFPRETYRGSSPHTRDQLYQPSIPAVLRDVYFSVGHLFHGAVVDVTHKLVSPASDGGEAVPVGKVVWGDDLLDVDEAACRIAGEPTADYLAAIRALRDQVFTEE